MNTQYNNAPPGEEETAEKTEQIDTSSFYTDKYNNTYDLVSLMMYLAGVDKRHFTEHIPDLTEKYNSYEKNTNAKIIRNLCKIRNAFEKNYAKIYNAFRSEFKNISTLPDLIPADAVYYLEEQNIRLYKSKPDITQYIITINNEISNRINNVKSMFPEWVNWQYIRPLFIMPNGLRPEGVKAAGNFYNSNRNRYPFHCYLNWQEDNEGNIFSSDWKFVTVLYKAHGEKFENRSLVSSAGDVLIGNLYDFIEKHDKTLIVVDCENSNPIKLAAALMSLTPEQHNKIHKIMLFDSDYTTSVWDTLCNTGITKTFKTEHIVVGRLYEHKSQVDMTLAANTCREIYQNNVDSVILVSSDSDYWALIQSLEGIDFLVMLEKEKSGLTIREALESKGYVHCFIDDFGTGAVYNIKTKTITNALQSRIDNIVNFNITNMFEDVLSTSWIEMSDKEKNLFFNRYIKTMRLKIEPDGAVKILMGE